jgi:hypothetical protein
MASKNVTQGKADLHIHSNFSDGQNSIEEILEFVETKTDLDLIAITDHDTIEGALLAQKIVKDKNYRFDVVVGEEVSTKLGHIVGLFLTKQINPDMTLSKTLEAIRAQNGIAVVSHPLFHTKMRSKGGLSMDGIGLANLIKHKQLIDAVEEINATPSLSRENLQAGFVNNTLLFKAEVGSSDAHIKDIIGKGTTIFKGKSQQDLVKSMRNYQTKAMSTHKGLSSMLHYGLFFLPKGLKILFYTMFGKNK